LTAFVGPEKLITDLIHPFFGSQKVSEKLR